MTSRIKKKVYKIRLIIFCIENIGIWSKIDDLETKEEGLYTKWRVSRS